MAKCWVVFAGHAAEPDIEAVYTSEAAAEARAEAIKRMATSGAYGAWIQEAELIEAPTPIGSAT